MISKKDASLKKGKARGIKQKPMRSYIKTATKAATHPVRSSILKSLKDSAKSTVELEEITGEARYNLYHHLNLLEDVDLVDGGYLHVGNGKGQGLFSDHLRQRHTFILPELFGIIQDRMGKALRQDHGSGGNRPCQATTPCFIRTGFQCATVKRL